MPEFDAAVLGGPVRRSPAGRPTVRRAGKAVGSPSTYPASTTEEAGNA